MKQRKVVTYIVTIMLVIGIFKVKANDVNTGGQRGIIRTLSAKTLGKTGVNFGTALRYAQDYNFVRGKNGVGNVIDTKTGLPANRTDSPRLLSGVGFIGYGLTETMDFSVALPIYYDQTGWGLSRSGIGDLEVALKLAYPFEKDYAWITQSYYLRIILPTGASNRGFFPRHSFYIAEDNAVNDQNIFTQNAVFFNPELIWTLHFDRLKETIPVTLTGNFGGIVAPNKSASAILAAIGLEYTPTQWINIFIEIAGESRVKWYTDIFSPEAFNNDPFWLTPGFKLNLPKGFYLIAAGDIGLSDDDNKFFSNFNRKGYQYSTRALPRWGAQFTFGWNGVIVERDRDHDGIIDKMDYCPDQKEDIDGVDDQDGCPDLDNDKDGMPDATDKCPNQAGDIRGCPQVDGDNDGIPDSLDKCPWQPEDFDNFEDSDGCPELDNDKDGLPDTKDKCPNKPEDIDGFEDADGCPDIDNDADGILDTEDKCPNHKGIKKEHGCPAVKRIKRGRLILNGVTFQPGSSVLTPNSYVILDQVVASLREWKEVKLEIQGHTDSQGSMAVNRRVSKNRAESVRQYLIGKGIDPSRLKAVGYGEERPIADNKTAAGRARNRRVEMHRID